MKSRGGKKIKAMAAKATKASALILFEIVSYVNLQDYCALLGLRPDRPGLTCGGWLLND